ncbi:phytoene/squalene synthase family protein [Cryptosporangium sp. NPDC051539]|uniref:phytoene/squalene synthase family protein n=1 Tax=Cryptosporangium sp. NPDC051539 TaxID=3363962 RepID=UPI0037BC99C0
MSTRELDAAGITGPELRASYAACRRLLAEHGKTYHLATLLLPPAKRPYVQALYGFARYADEIVDDLSSTLTDDEKAAELDEFAVSVLGDLKRGESDHPITRALVDTVVRWDVDVALIEAFLVSMRMDLTVTEYATYDDLMTYVYGSAAVIGLEMVPILEHPGVPRSIVEPYAHDLGVAFQLANFVRDVGEDLRRGRIYLPMEDLALFGVDRDRLARGVVDGPIRRLLAYEVARCREIYRAAWPGFRLLAPESQECMKTAFLLYGGILDAVEQADYQVLDRRVAVSNARRARVALPALVRAVRARA